MLGDGKKPSHRERICYAIDDALLQKPQTFEELLGLLREAGYDIKGKKVPSLFGGDQKIYIRISQNAAGAHPKGAMQIRNREMVDRSDLVIFCVERSSGGAYQTMKYAMKQEKIIFNLCLSEIQGNENDKFNEHISSDRNLNHSI